MNNLYTKIIKSILNGLNEAGLFDDGLLDSDESTLDELNISDNLKVEYVDLGLSSNTLWCSHNIGAENPEEYGDYISFYEGYEHYKNIPTQKLFEELIDECKWIWINNFDDYKVNGYKIIGKNNRYIFLPASGQITLGDDNNISNKNMTGYYWTSSTSSEKSFYANNIKFDFNHIFPTKLSDKDELYSARQVKTKNINV